MSAGDAPAREGVGTLLRTAREERGLTLAEVSAETRIRATLIGEIENDDFTHCAAPVYARGHLRSIARAVGIDPEPVVDRYNATHGAAPDPGLPLAPDPAAPKAPSGGSAPTEPEPRYRVEKPAGSRFRQREAGALEPPRYLRRDMAPKQGARWMPLTIGALIVVVLVALAVLLIPGGKDKPATSAPAPLPTPPASASAKPTPSASATPPADTVSAKITVGDTPSWLQVSDGQKAIFTQVLPAGSVKTFGGTKELRLDVGNAGTVSLSCNGHDFGTQGNPGAVVTLAVTLNYGGGCVVTPQ